ncbi:outer membrane efflux protein [gut metagenome]|uniref:Outer membrane efflux protein n=1 Tax=gut metagenome TaxID=749906 RepID=J9FDC7_9ZZZZ
MKMKLTYYLFVGMLTIFHAQAQENNHALQQILQMVESNNKDLKANQQITTAQKAKNRSENNLANPTLSYAHLWDSKNSEKTVGEIVVSQSFDFPSLYISRSKVNRLKAGSLDAQSMAQRQQILLQAQEVCLDIIYLYQQQQLLDERLKNAENLCSYYQQRLEKGDANILETNKINLELLNVRTEVRTNSTNLHNKLKELLLLNSGQPLTPGRSMLERQIPQAQALGLTQYPTVNLPTDFTSICDELVNSTPTVLAAVRQNEATHLEVSVNKQGWLPKLEIGYRRNTENGHPLNGVVVGMSFPIFENRNKVKIAKAQALSSNYQKENITLLTKSALWKLYDEACTLQTSIREYQDTFTQQKDLELLKKALIGGEINIIEYFVEISIVYQSKQNLLALENQYQKTMARIYQSKL